MSDTHPRDRIYLEIESRRLRHEREGRKLESCVVNTATARERLLDRVALYVARLEELDGLA